VTAMPASATAMNTQRRVSRYGTSGRIADLGLGEDALRHLDPGCAQRGHAGRAAALHGAAVGQNLARGRRLRGEGRLPDGEPLAPLPRRPEVDMCMNPERG
jgi:hypothetical protein